MEVNITAISALNSPVASSGHIVAFWLLLAGFIFVILCYSCGLQTLGFAATGVVQGSIAALWQSSIAIGNGVGVVAGSLFAILQSVAMRGIAAGAFLLPFLLIGLAVVVSIGLGPQLVHWAKDFLQWFDENVNVAQFWKESSQWYHENVNIAQIWRELLQWFDENVNVAQIWKESSQWFHENVNIAKIWRQFLRWFHENLNVAQIWKEFLQWMKGDVHEILPVNLCDGRRCLQ